MKKNVDEYLNSLLFIKNVRRCKNMFDVWYTILCDNLKRETYRSLYIYIYIYNTVSERESTPCLLIVVKSNKTKFEKNIQN